MPTWVQEITAGIVEWQRQAKSLALFDFGDAFFDLGRGELVEAPKLIVRSVVPPGGIFRTLLPALVCEHLCLPLARRARVAGPLPPTLAPGRGVRLPSALPGAA